MIYINPTFARGGWTLFPQEEGEDTLTSLSRLAARASEDPVQMKQRNAVWAWGDVPEELLSDSSQPTTRVSYPRLDHVFLDYDHLTDEDVEALCADTGVPGLRVSSFSDGKEPGVRKLHLIVPLASPVSVSRGNASPERSSYASAVRQVNKAVEAVLGHPLDLTKGGGLDAASLEVTRLCFFSGHWDRSLPVNLIVPGRFDNKVQQTKPGPRRTARSQATQTRDFKDGESPEAWLTRLYPTVEAVAGLLEDVLGKPVLVQDPGDESHEWRYYHTDGSISSRGGIRSAHEQGSIMTARGEATAPEGTVALHSTSLDWRTGFVSTAELAMALLSYYQGGDLSVADGTLTSTGPSFRDWEQLLTSLGLSEDYQAERVALFEAASSGDASQEDIARAEDAVRALLDRDKHGQATGSRKNQKLVLSKDPLCQMLRRNSFTSTVYLPPEGMTRLGVLPYESHLYDRLLIPRLWGHIADTYGENVVGREERQMRQLLDSYPNIKRSTPVGDYLAALAPSDGHELEDSIPWARTPEDKNRVTRFLIAAYHQITRPGTAYEPILVLDDPVGGVGKSSFLLQLFGAGNWQRWKVGQMMSDNVQQTLGASWLVLDDDSSSLTTDTAATELRTFQSSPGGAYRQLYTSALVHVPPHTVTAITSNSFAPPSDKALRRRLLVVPCSGTREEGVRLFHEKYTRPGWREEVWAEVKYRYEVLGQRPEQPRPADYDELERFIARTPVQEALEDLAHDLVSHGRPMQHGLPMDVEVLHPGGKWEGVPFIRVRGANQYLTQLGIRSNEANSTHLGQELLRCGFVRGPQVIRVDGKMYRSVYYPVVAYPSV